MPIGNADELQGQVLDGASSARSRHLQLDAARLGSADDRELDRKRPADICLHRRCEGAATATYRSKGHDLFARFAGT